MLLQDTFVNPEYVPYLRKILNLSEGYDKRAYPEYSLAINKYLLPLTENEYQNFKKDNFHEITVTIPNFASFEYPRGSTISYHVNIKQISFINNIQEDAFEIFFCSLNNRLAIYSKEAYKPLIEKMEAFFSNKGSI